jgi:hypothetical protein
VISQADVIARVRKGEGTYDWVPVPGVPGVDCFQDALKLDGIRVPVTARTAQTLADLFAGSLSTALLEDRIYQGAALRVVPRPSSGVELGIDIRSDRAVEIFNEDLDQQIANAGGLQTGIVASVGKAWVLDRVLATSPQKAANYGMHAPSAPLRALTPGLRVYQDLGWVHNADHWDYSQTCRLVRVQEGYQLPAEPPLKGLTRQPLPPLRAAQRAGWGELALACAAVAIIWWDR